MLFLLLSSGYDDSSQRTAVDTPGFFAFGTTTDLTTFAKHDIYYLKNTLKHEI
jgi:hypothetical protein